MGEPTTIRAGDSITWDRALPEYPAADGWSLSYRLLGTAGAYAIDATGDGNDYSISLSASATAIYLAGDYSLTGWATKGTGTDAQRATIYSGRCRVLPNLATLAAPFDGRSQARQALEKLRALYYDYLANRATRLEATVGTRTVRYRSLVELKGAIADLETQVRAEEMAERIGQGELPSGRVVYRAG